MIKDKIVNFIAVFLEVSDSILWLG